MGDIRYIIQKRTTSKAVEVSNRIEAKYRLWDFIYDIRNEITKDSPINNHFERQLIGYTIFYLSPHFTALEIEKELRNIHMTINTPVPKGFISFFMNAYSDKITRILSGKK